MSTTKKLYAFMTFGAALGAVAAFLQTLEKLTLLKDETAALYCNVSSVFNCSTVLNAPQSSLFGFPNSIMCLVLFMIFLAVALVGLTGGAISKGMRFGVQGLSLFTLAFALWFLYQSTYVIAAVCVFCIFCFIGLLLVNGAWLRLNAAELPERVLSFVKRGYDIPMWIILALIVVAAVWLQFYA